MTPPVGFIVNPLSHTVQRKGSILEQAHEGLENTNLIRINNFDALRAEIERLAQARPSAVFVEGGDGTLQAVMSAWPGLADEAEGLPDFAILPGGSTNLASKIAGLRSRTARQVIDSVTAFRAGRPVEKINLRALKLEAACLDRALIGMLLSTGSLARAMIYTQTEIHGDGQRGSLAVADAALRFALAPDTYQDTDGKPILRLSQLRAGSKAFMLDGPHALSLMTTLPCLSLGLKPFWGQGEGTIAFTHAAWPIKGFRRALLRIVTGAAGPSMAQHGLTSYKADALELVCSDVVVLDGELLPLPENTHITINPTRPICFLR